MMEGISKHVEPGVHTESAELLMKLAMPRVADCPDVALQNNVIERLEAALKQKGIDRPLLFLGAVELTGIPDAGDESAMLHEAKLIDLPSSFTAQGTTPSHALATNLNAFPVVVAAGLAQDVACHALLTMIDAGQVGYLRRSGFVGKGWKILVEIHYYRTREKQTHRFHKDTLGQTVFVNLNYVTKHSIAGPEYILNPPVVDDHDKKIAETLPEEFLNDLRWVRGVLGEPSKINVPEIPANGYVAFVDEAIHHMTPLYGHRTVKGAYLAQFLAEEYGATVFADAETAFDAYVRENSSITGFLLSIVSDPKPYSSYLQRIAGNEADMWYRLMEMVKVPGKAYNRAHLDAAGMSEPLIDKLLAGAPGWEGFQQVTIPKSDSAAIKPQLKRQMSEDALKGKVPPEVTGDRCFFRTWVRAVRVDQHS